MNPLTKQQLVGLAKHVAATSEEELNCSECGKFAAEFAERQLAGLPLDEMSAKVEQHLAVCPECTEEVLALKKILESESRS